MLEKVLCGVGASVVAAALMYAQAAARGRGRKGRPPAPEGSRPPAWRPWRRRGAETIRPQAQWAAMPPKAKEYVDKARALAGTTRICSSTSASSARRRAARRTRPRDDRRPEQRAASAAVPGAEPGAGRRRAAAVRQLLLDRQHRHRRVADHLERRLHPVRHDEQRGRRARHHLPAIKKLNLDPMKIKYLVFGHNHFDHTGGGEYIQRMTGAKAVMHRDDWELYLRAPVAAAAAVARRGAGDAAGGTGCASRRTAPEDEARHRRHRRHDDQSRRRRPRPSSR